MVGNGKILMQTFQQNSFIKTGRQRSGFQQFVISYQYVNAHVSIRGLSSFYSSHQSLPWCGKLNVDLSTFGKNSVLLFCRKVGTRESAGRSF